MPEPEQPKNTLKICAFGALNVASYEEFEGQVLARAPAMGIKAAVVSAAPYPNAQAVSVPGRPLRGEALKDPEKARELFAAVAADARAIGAEAAGLCCMPCMSMIGFHAGVQAALGRDILPLAPALAAAYAGVDRLGVIHMRPAKKRIEEIFGAKAVTPDEAGAEKLLAAEAAARQSGSPAAVEAAMADIAAQWRDAGIQDVLFARADAPKAKKSPACAIEGLRILSYFDILAEAALRSAATPT
jgi:hypothetical protein